MEKAISQKKSPKKWSGSVTEHSNAMDLEKDIFKSKDPKKIAASIKKSAEKANVKRRARFNLPCQ